VTADLTAASKATMLVDTVSPVATSVTSKFDQAPPMLPPTALRGTTGIDPTFCS